MQVPWKPQNQYKYDYLPIPNGFAKGDGVSVEAGTSYPMEVLIGEQPGCFCFAALLVQKDGDSYKEDPHGNPLFPVFRLTRGPLPPPKEGTSYAPHAEEDGPVWRSLAKEAPDKGIFSR